MMKIIGTQTLQREAVRKAAADLAQRQQATGILDPGMMLGKGRKASAAVRALTTTLGGQLRPITSEDLKTFRSAVQRLQAERKDVGGILAGEVIAQSRPEDLKRCREQIHHAVPFRFAGGVVQFQTSASRENGETRHIVDLQLTGWSQAVATPLTPLQAAKQVTEQPLRFSCSCLHYRYFLRYVATVGGWNYGRPEPGFPKQKNPSLVGVACKHALRVMAELSATGVRGQIARAITQERKRLEGKTRKTTLSVARADAEKLLTRQAAKPRDVSRMARKFTEALAGKAPAAARRALTPEAVQREAAIARSRLSRLGMTTGQIEQVVAAILAAGVSK